ncbi:ice-binding family protein [Nocardioides sp. CF8]|uniref:ice-binding family protein n=1 Tax=Nocardioides sp. CF8 TaxID=110319 RepID=UPI0018DE2F5F|nr:ice-binding family protein [Nocardioides sp. CF8]
MTTPATAIADVDVSWTAGSGGVAPEGYFVARHKAAVANSPATVEPACAGGPTALVSGLSCTDTGVADGDYTYVVFAAFASWTARSSPSDPVHVTNVAGLAFTAAPHDVTVGATMTPAVTVALRNAAGEPITGAGVPVTLTIGTNPSGGVLGGDTTRGTDAGGQVSFGDLSIDRPGAGYTLVASSPGLAPAVSAEFAVVAAPLLGDAGKYSVLAGTAIVSTGLTSISGDIGVSPATAISGLGPDNVGGQIHAGDADAAQAQDAMSLASAELAALPFPAQNELVGDLGGRTLTAGVYHSTAALALTGILILDAQHNPGATFIFQADAAFNTAAAARIVLTNGAKASNIFWVVTGATGAGAASYLAGTILGRGAITLGAGTELIGRALSKGTVTLSSNSIRFTAGLPPTMTITGGAIALTKDSTPTISGTTSAPAASPVTVSVTGQTLSTVVAADGSWTVTTATLTAGVHNITAKVRAPSGDGATARQALTLEVNPPPVLLGTASSFSVLGTTGVVSTGVTHLSGDLGVSPSTSVTGFGPLQGGTLDGDIHAGDAAAASARAALVTALDDASTRTPHTEIAGDLGGRTFHVGVHHITAALALTGTVILDGEGDPNAVFIFQTDAAFNTAAGSTVLLAGGAQAANVFWIVNGAAGTGALSSLSGSILARGAITLGAGATVRGRALSLGTVTLASNRLSGVMP